MKEACRRVRKERRRRAFFFREEIERRRRKRKTPTTPSIQHRSLFSRRFFFFGVKGNKSRKKVLRINQKSAGVPLTLRTILARFSCIQRYNIHFLFMKTHTHRSARGVSCEREIEVAAWTSPVNTLDTPQTKKGKPTKRECFLSF